MEEDEDDFYADAQHQGYGDPAQEAPERDVKMEPSNNEDEDEEDDSDDDVQFITDKAEGVKQELGTTTRTAKQTTSQDRTSSDSKPARSGTPQLQDGRSGSLQPTAVKGTLTHNGKEGKDFPEVRTSKIDVNGIPTWPANGKPITEVDIDADLAEHTKPWRLPGTDLTDFFNYGFDEYTWAQYCVRQKEVQDSIAEGKQRDAEMRAFFEGGGNNAAGGGSGMPPGMPQMPGMGNMPNPQESKCCPRSAIQAKANWNLVAQQMMAQGYDPMDQNAFMTFMMSQGYGPPGGPGGGFGSGGQNSTSPLPQGGQGFQPPQGPGGGDQGGFGGNMEGYSAQQMAIIQGQQQGGHGGRGRGRGRGRF